MPDKPGLRADGGEFFIVQKTKFYLVGYKEIPKEVDFVAQRVRR